MIVSNVAALGHNREIAEKRTGAGFLGIVENDGFVLRFLIFAIVLETFRQFEHTSVARIEGAI